MVAQRTAPTDTVCTACGRSPEDGATFRRWRKTCRDCERAYHEARRRPVTLLLRDDSEAGAPTSPVAYVRAQLGRCPSPDRDLAAARAYWAAIARVCRVMGLDEQAALWESLAATWGQ